jgi:protein PhnA
VERAQSRCELCAGKDGLTPHDVPPNSGASAETSVLVCATCEGHLAAPAAAAKHWFCLKEAIWSEHTAVKVLALRILRQLTGESWAADLASQVYLDDEALAWADAGTAGGGGDGGDRDGDGEGVRIVDSNGTVLSEGDTVTLIKDLEVKGGGFTAKRGTTVKGISLTDDARYVEGRVNGIRIVLVAAYLKKA